MSRLIRSLSVLSLAVLMSAPLLSQAATSPWRRAPEGTVEVTQFIFTRSIVKRRPTGEVSTVPLDGKRVYGFIKVFNKGPEQTVTMTWERNGRVHLRHSLKVGRSPSWHTWTCLTASKYNRGEWRVTVEDQDGKILSQQLLTVDTPRLAKK